jgi:predicted small lipoprotein YifL
MTAMRKWFASAMLAVALAACGKVGDLQPVAGQAMPAKAYGQNEAPGAEELSTPAVQTRPGRSDELMRRSERRREDPFDLAPGAEADKGDPPAESTAEDPKKPG